MDLMSPMVATWVRSSSHSPRLRNRRARYSTRGRCSSTSVALSLARSGSPAGSLESRSNSSLACVRSGEECSDRGSGAGSSLTVTSTSNSSVTWTSYSLLNSSAPALSEDDGDPVAGVQPGVDGAGQRGQHGPRERVAGGLPRLRRGHRHGDGHQVGAELKDAFQVGARDGLSEQHRACLVDRDTQVLDLVEGEVQPGGESGGGGTQHGQVGALGRHLDLYVICRVAATRRRRRCGGVFGHVSPSVISRDRRCVPATDCNLPCPRNRTAAPPPYGGSAAALQGAWPPVAGLMPGVIPPASPALSPRRSWRSPRSWRAACRPSRRRPSPWCRRPPPAWWPR